MVKNEQFRDNDQLKRVLSSELATPLSLRSSMLQTTSINIPQRTIDPRAIDISSIKGRFAWEKIALGDTYIPVIFRGTTKYFCVKMLHKLLSEYPNDFIRRSAYYRYGKPIDLYVATPNELTLLNKINVHHCHGDFSREPFTATDELVRVSDFLPFYEHLRLYVKSPTISRTSSVSSLKPILPQPQQPMQRSPDFVVHMPNGIRGNSGMPVMTTSNQIQSLTNSESTPANGLFVSQSIVTSPPTVRPTRLPKYNTPPPPSATARQPLQQQLASSSSTQEPIASSTNSTIASKNIVIPNRSWSTSTPVSSSQWSTSTTSISTMNSTSSEPTISPSMSTNDEQLSISVSEKSVTPVLKSTSPSPSTSKSPRLYSGWLQINKLYTPYISNNSFNHHLYKIPVSLLTFYDLIKVPSLENNPNESKDSSFSFEQTPVTPKEIELINDLCLKQNIKPFSIDTKLINLSTFYRYSSANILFVKELPLSDPKASICKDWSSIVQINGGICRLRNTATLHEQTVPFIGNNLLKNFIISSQCLASASITTPTTAEHEFLQLVLFFSNISISLNNAKLIDIESVQKEYNVDFILLFNDKFPLNVLDYQHQNNRSSTTQSQVNPNNSSAATNTFVQSTPPPSPVSSPTNSIPTNPTSQLPLTSSSISSNRYQKIITFHGHPMTAYICSGLGTNAQRECISVRAICDVLYPHSSILDKLEARLLRLLKLININRFRPQNQQTMGLTRLVDMKDVEKHWDYIQQGMRSLFNNESEKEVVREVTSTSLDKDLKASKLDEEENNCKNVGEKTAIKVNKGLKRLFEGEVGKKGEEEEDTIILKRMDKFIRLSNDSNGQSEVVRPILTRAANNQKICLDNTSDDDNNNNNNNDDDDDDDDNDDDDHKTPPKTRQNSIRSIKIVPKRSVKKITKKPNLRQNTRLSIKSSVSSRKVSKQPIKKKTIKVNRKRSTPRIRTHKQSVAAWIRKYGIEDCYVRLDLYNSIYDTGKN